MRALDHIVLATRDLPSTARRFAALGFQVGSRNRHPWGTENHIIQFRSTFLELIGLADDFRPVPADDPAFPFAGFIARYLQRHESGIAMAVLRADDAAADAELFARQGIGSGRTLPFSRSAQVPDGHDRTVAFTIAFAEAPGMPSAGFFSCQQHRPENFWNPAFQHHANTAREITGFTLVSDDVERAASFLATFAAQPRPESKLGECLIPVTTGAIRVVRDGRPSGQTGTAMGEPHIAAMHLRVGALSAVEAAAGPGGWVTKAGSDGGTLICSLTQAPGFTLSFEGPR